MKAWELNTHAGLDEHGTLVAHLPQNVEREHGLVRLHQTHGRLHGDEHSRPSDSGAANIPQISLASQEPSRLLHTQTTANKNSTSCRRAPDEVSGS